MIQIKRWVFNPFQENTYLLHNEQKDAFLIDPGCYEEHEKQQLKSAIGEEGFQLKAIINTHGHVDHVLGNAFVHNTFKVPVWLHKEDAPLLDNAPQMGVAFGFSMELSPKADKFLAHGDKLYLGEEVVEVLHVPGHSRGSVALYVPESNFIVVGDVLFQASVGRTDLPGGNQHDLLDSIHKYLLTLPEETVVFPGHGPETSIAFEKENNPFLQRA